MDARGFGGADDTSAKNRSIFCGVGSRAGSAEAGLLDVGRRAAAEDGRTIGRAAAEDGRAAAEDGRAAVEDGREAAEDGRDIRFG